jgi:predicted nuclease of predicted toxin-antitoxin system
MMFLVDAQLPPALCRWLEARGEQAVHVSDIGLGAASDVVIAAHAEASGMALISKDEDFIMLRLPDRFALIWLRCGNATNRALAVWLEPRWDEISALLDRGERFIEAR